MSAGPSINAWPAVDIEIARRRSARGSTTREIAYDGVARLAIRTAPDCLNLHRCSGCGGVYTDTPSTSQRISRAYPHYYCTDVSGEHPIVRQKCCAP